METRYFDIKFQLVIVRMSKSKSKKRKEGQGESPSDFYIIILHFPFRGRIVINHGLISETLGWRVWYSSSLIFLRFTRLIDLVSSSSLCSWYRVVTGTVSETHVRVPMLVVLLSIRLLVCKSSWNWALSCNIIYLFSPWYCTAVLRADRNELTPRAKRG